MSIVLFGGIDPGAKGGIVVINHDFAVVRSEVMPWVVKSGPDIRAVLAIIQNIQRAAQERGGTAFLVLEHQQTRPGEGVVGAFTMGRSFGILETCLVAAGIQYDVSRPNKGSNGWQQILNGVEGEDTKAQSIALCRRMIPDLDLAPGRTRKAHEGLADAGAIALYARKMNR